MEKSTHSPDYRLLTRMLREARVESGMTQVALAERLGVTQSFVSKLERGELRLDFIQVRNYCHAIGVSFTSFVRDYEKRLQRGGQGRK